MVKFIGIIFPCITGLSFFSDAILEKIQEAGFEVCLQKEVQLTEEQAKIFYKEHEGQPFYEDLITEMTKWEHIEWKVLGLEVFPSFLGQGHLWFLYKSYNFAIIILAKN